MKILIPVDKSKNCTFALTFAASLAAVSSKSLQIEIVTVADKILKKRGGFDPQQAFAEAGVDLPEVVQQPTEKFFNSALAHFKNVRDGVKVKTKILYGDHPSEAIAKEAKRFEADIIMMGARGLSSLKSLLFGSVTSGVLAECKIPVLVLRDKRTFESPQFHIAVAVDGSKASLKGVKHIAEHRGLYKESEIVALTVSADVPDSVLKKLSGKAIPQDNPQEYFAQEIAKAQKAEYEAAFKPVRKQIAGAKLACKEVGLVGVNPARAIADFVKENGTDLLILGSRGRGRFKSALMGSTATNIAALTTVPLLIIR